jgi:MerR family transcriptional regulator, light-induced transcriptional regulator
MSESQPHGNRQSDDPAGRRVDALAGRALSMVAERKVRGQRPLMPLFVGLLSDTALSLTREPFFPITHRMAQMGITPEEIADDYIPAVARQMGDLWCQDQIGFAAVTIGAARLQGLLRELGAEWRADGIADAGAATILVMVTADAQHTLGASVLAGQLRRRGLSVRLALGAGPEDVGQLLWNLPIDAVFLSGSLGESLESLRRVVDAVRAAALAPLPVVIGGAVLMDGALPSEIKALTGADLVTCDLDEALTLCGLTTIPRGARDARRS